ncbi:hypothetical protein niasHT_024623 [Heterodera trifolii]|uniref:Uncharacterized protein n=1 Tax=Heterodera trifolii TaxID=157864 RepID=A0ABD2K7J0_9BILA
MLKPRPLLRQFVQSRLSSSNSSIEPHKKITTVPISAKNSANILHDFVSSLKTVNLPPSAVPNASILDKIVPKPSQRMRITDRIRRFQQIVAEIDFLYTVSTEVPSALSDEHWVQLLDTVSAAEREHLLRTIHYAQLVEKAAAAERQTLKNGTKTLEAIAGANVVDENDGDGCVAHSSASATTTTKSTDYHQMFGDEFCDQSALKSRMDTHFGLALCRNFLLEPADRMPNLFVDCRFMYAHKTAHILSAANIVNFFADDTVNRIVKNQWHFLYGTPNEQSKEMGGGNFVPHPFAPQVTTRGLSEICERNSIPKDQIAYVSQRAIDYLPENIGQFRAFVLLPFDDWEQKWLLPTKAALAEKLPCYRLPLDQHICDVSRNIPCWLVANILRKVYTGRMSWAMAAHHWGRELTSFEYRPNSDQIDPEQLPFSQELYMEKRKLRAQMLEKLEHFSDMLLNEKQQQKPSGEAASYVVTGANAISVTEKGQKKQQQQQQIAIRHARRVGLTLALVGNVKTRKYSREERNRRRMEEAKKEEDESELDNNLNDKS